jgi:hypothetical protein
MFWSKFIRYVVLAVQIAFDAGIAAIITMFSNTRLADRQLLRIQLRPLRPPAVAVALIVRSDS